MTSPAEDTQGLCSDARDRDIWIRDERNTTTTCDQREPDPFYLGVADAFLWKYLVREARDTLRGGDCSISKSMRHIPTADRVGSKQHLPLALSVLRRIFAVCAFVGLFGASPTFLGCSARVGTSPTESAAQVVGDGRVTRPHSRRIWSIAISPQGDRIVTGDEEGLLNLWEYPSLRLVATLGKGKGRITRLVFSHSGERIAAAGGFEYGTPIWLYNVPSATLRGVLQGHLSEVTALLFLPSDKVLLSASADSELIEALPREGNPVRAWRMDILALLRELNKEGAVIRALALSADQKRILGATREGQLYVWAVEELRLLERFQICAEARGIVDLPRQEGILVYRYAEPAAVVVFDYRGAMIRSIALGEQSCGFAYSEKREMFAFVADCERIIVSDLYGNSIIPAIDAPYPGYFWCLAFDSTGDALVVGTSEGELERVVIP